MNIRFNRLLVVGIVAAAAVLSLTQVAQAGPPPPVVPSKIQVPDGNKVFLVGHAVGVQIYSCNATPSGFVWGFVAPHANLYDDHGKLIITHFAGPTWQAMDGSRVVGHLVDSVTVDPTAIAWLLLSASTTPGPDGDRLVATTFVQRIATTGGLAPPGRRLQRGNGRDRGRGPLHRRLLLLEAHRWLMQRPCPEEPAEGANRNHNDGIGSVQSSAAMKSILISAHELAAIPLVPPGSAAHRPGWLWGP